ncbi:MAG: citrate transporter, partial [Lachnospiraceae bacterium]|nr:citrate transporter [Lachnospiraceae bacterium]
MTSDSQRCNRILEFIKKETILTIALLLAAVSMFIVPPSAVYADYIDWNTLLLLFNLMAVVAGFQKLGVFSMIGSALLQKIHMSRQLTLILVFLPFFFSMLITNDVALITFVPFTLIVLRLSGKEQLLLPTVVLQTLAANLGSMLMPMGNPQNLYLYTLSGLTLIDFIKLMLPLFLLAAVILFLAVLFIKNTPVEIAMESSAKVKIPGFSLLSYSILLILCILCILKYFSPLWLTGIICLYLVIRDRSIFQKIDYSLLATFIGFFIFIGNISQIESFRAALQGIIVSHEIPVAILSSQIISNVPAALLLSGFTDQYAALIIGANLGGLGTLIASMASLISYKQIAREYPDKRSRYLGLFTFANLIVLGILYGAL